MWEVKLEERNIMVQLVQSTNKTNGKETTKGNLQGRLISLFMNLLLIIMINKFIVWSMKHEKAVEKKS